MRGLLVVEQDIRLPDGVIRQPDYFQSAVDGRVPAQVEVDPRLSSQHIQATYIQVSLRHI